MVPLLRFRLIYGKKVMHVKLKRTPGIYLVGFMGSGKTTVGKLLAGELGWRFVDLDDEIEAAQGASISQIFAGRGEAEFRRIETEAIGAQIREIERGHPTVLALGGGAFAQPANRALLQDSGISVWLDCDFELARARVARESHRPLARDAEKFEQLFHARREAYAQADYRIAVDGDDPQIPVKAILALPIFR
jgi:shikimate kinase